MAERRSHTVGKMRVHELARDQAHGAKKGRAREGPAEFDHETTGRLRGNLPCGVRWQMFAVEASPVRGRVLKSEQPAIAAWHAGHATVFH